jgi:hypothetical protein
MGYVVISREWTSEGVKCQKAVFEGYCNVQGGCGVAATSACITLIVAVFFFGTLSDCRCENLSIVDILPV